MVLESRLNTQDHEITGRYWYLFIGFFFFIIIMLLLFGLYDRHHKHLGTSGFSSTFAQPSSKQQTCSP